MLGWMTGYVRVDAGVCWVCRGLLGWMPGYAGGMPGYARWMPGYARVDAGVRWGGCRGMLVMCAGGCGTTQWMMKAEQWCR